MTIETRLTKTTGAWSNSPKVKATVQTEGDD